MTTFCMRMSRLVGASKNTFITKQTILSSMDFSEARNWIELLILYHCKGYSFFLKSLQYKHFVT